MSDLQTWQFSVYGVPKPQKRPRIVRNKQTGFVHGVDPEVSADWKASVSLQALEHRPDIPSTQPLFIGMVFYMPKPKSLRKKDNQALHTKRPDIDNLFKAVVDSLRGIYYADDSQICEVYKRKQYTEGTPGVAVWIHEIDKFMLAPYTLH